jgi:hypothetical protein
VNVGGRRPDPGGNCLELVSGVEQGGQVAGKLGAIGAGALPELAIGTRCLWSALRRRHDQQLPGRDGTRSLGRIEHRIAEGDHGLYALA